MPRTPPSRRRFLQTLGALSLSGALPLPMAAPARAQAQAEPVLLVVHLDGGCDGLSAVVPHADPGYAAARPTLAIPAGEVLPISGALGFHPAMGGLKAWYDRGSVAVVNGVGYPGSALSHFPAKAVYWRGATDPVQSRTGWLGRALDALPAVDTLAGACLEARSPGSMRATGYTAPTIGDPGRYRLRGPHQPAESEAQLAAAQAIFGQSSTGDALFDGLLVGGVAALESVDPVQSALATYRSPVEYGPDEFGQAMKLAAQLIEADLGVRVLTTSLRGFDTHSGQAATLDRLLGQFSDGVDAFMQDAVAGGFADRVVILAWTEFGRRVAENGSGGTDHGTAAPMFLIGQGVRGGLHGEHPGLGDLVDGNLRATTDFRSVYAAVLADWLGLDAARILGGEWPRPALFV
jgi:uncharacterized protein (DUF1501 family)